MIIWDKPAMAKEEPVEEAEEIIETAQQALEALEPLEVLEEEPAKSPSRGFGN
jgi:hypothetical protein